MPSLLSRHVLCWMCWHHHTRHQPVDIVHIIEPRQILVSIINHEINSFLELSLVSLVGTSICLFLFMYNVDGS